MSKNSKLKKKIGEKTYQFLSRNFNDPFLKEHLPEMFGILSDIRYIQEDEYSKLKILLNEKLENKIEETKEVTKSAKQLLDEAGFLLDDTIEKREDFLKYKKYFKEDESLCKFTNSRGISEYSRAFFILRKNFEEIKRSPNPRRQDEYSTSIMSVGISPNRRNVEQITSRYNHTVDNCDNTYNSNLDNIVEGLTEAFNRDYNLSIRKGQTVEFTDFYYNDGKFFHYNYEINGKKYGDNTIDGVYYNSSEFLIFDNFILNLRKKEIKTACGTRDGLIGVINQKIEKEDKIQISKIEKNTLLKIGSLEIEISKNRVIRLTDPELTGVGDNFLYFNQTLTIINLPKLVSCGDNFLYSNEDLVILNLPKLISHGRDFLYWNASFRKIEALEPTVS